MIVVDLPEGSNSPLSRGLAAFLSSVLEVPLADLPYLGHSSIDSLLGACKSWLAGRGYGLIPIHDPRSFQWAGWWFAIVNGSDSDHADGADRQVAVLAFGTPPGVVLSPQDPALLSRATADLAISRAYAVASLDPVLPQQSPEQQLRGTVELLAIAAAAEAPMHFVEQVRALAGRGLEGDRYAVGAGTFSPKAVPKPGYDLTLIAAEVVEELTARDARLGFASTRRNVLTRGVDVNALVGRDFTIGEVHCRGRRLAEPCAHRERIAGPGLLRPLLHRGGVRVDILDDGVLRTGSSIIT